MTRPGLLLAGSLRGNWFRQVPPPSPGPPLGGFGVWSQMSSSKAMSADGEVDTLGGRTGFSRCPLEPSHTPIPPQRGVQAPGAP